MIKIAIFASGSGTNAENIAKYFDNHLRARVDIILSNNPNAYVLERAKKLHIPAIVFTREQLYEDNTVLNLLKFRGIDFIALAGFLWKIPENIIKAYPQRIVNIHPALLPKYGGKGMYGNHVHKAVLEAGEKKSGITIHYVNENYDEGDIIFQTQCPVLPDDTVETLAQRLHQLEYEHYPRIIEQLITNL